MLKIQFAIRLKSSLIAISQIIHKLAFSILSLLILTNTQLDGIFQPFKIAIHMMMEDLI
jgi:hypothetical protein